MKTADFKHYGYKVGTGLKVFGISTDNFLKFNLRYPNIFEQKKVSTFINKLEKIITLYERKIELLNKIKLFLLNKIFKNLYKSDNFVKLDDIANISTGKLDANAMDEYGKYDFYTSGIKKYKINSYSFVGPAITIAGNGATVGYLHLADGKFDAYQRTYVINNFHNISRKFIFYSLKYELPRIIHKESRVGSIPYIVLNMLQNLKIPKINIKIQEEVSLVLDKISNLVFFYSNKKDFLEHAKKKLLDTMFLTSY